MRSTTSVRLLPASPSVATTAAAAWGGWRERGTSPNYAPRGSRSLPEGPPGIAATRQQLGGRRAQLRRPNRLGETRTRNGTEE